MKLVDEKIESFNENQDRDSDINEIYKIFSPCLIYEAGLISLKDFLKLLNEDSLTITFQEYVNIFFNI